MSEILSQIYVGVRESSRYFSQILAKLDLSRQIFEK